MSSLLPAADAWRPPPHMLLDSALLLLPPISALVYALAVQIFLACWRECRWTDHASDIALRTAPVVAAWAVLQAARAGSRGSDCVEDGGGGDELAEDGVFVRPPSLWAAAICSLLLSAHLICRTRIDRIRGGPAPSLSPDAMRGRVVLITGANSGIGRETARHLHPAGATVVMACRDEGRCREAMEDILGRSQSRSRWRRRRRRPTAPSTETETEGASTKTCGSDRSSSDDPADRLLYLPLDLSSLSSVRSAASAFRSLGLPLHVLINNAGLMMSSRKTSADGFELTVACNHLGHFLLTLELLPLLRRSAVEGTVEGSDKGGGGDARVVTVSSSTYALSAGRGVGVEWDDLNCERRTYGMFAQYSRSKLANVLFGRELARREAARAAAASSSTLSASTTSSLTSPAAPSGSFAVPPGTVSSHVLHPGLVRTDVVRNMPWYLYYPNILFGFAVSALQKTPAEGAYTSVYCACSPELRGRSGGYYGNSREERLEGSTEEKGGPLGEDEGRRLWEISEKMVGWGVSVESEKRRAGGT